MKFTITFAIAVMLAGCTAQTKKPIWIAVDRPEEFNVRCMFDSPRLCSFSIEGFWRSTSGPGSEIAAPDVVSIRCVSDEKKCFTNDASVNAAGKLEIDSGEFDISMWTDDQIIATTIGGLCDIGNQITVDIPNKTVMRRTYPTKPQTGICCGAFSKTDTYVLHTGFWELRPMVGKTFLAVSQ
jgi:hypothetical protein